MPSFTLAHLRVDNGLMGHGSHGPKVSTLMNHVDHGSSIVIHCHLLRIHGLTECRVCMQPIAISIALVICEFNLG